MQRCATAAAAADLKGFQPVPLAMARTALRNHVKWNSILEHALNQRECVGRVIKCTRQLCDKDTHVQECNSVKSTCILTKRKREREREREREHNRRTAETTAEEQKQEQQRGATLRSSAQDKVSAAAQRKCAADWHRGAAQQEHEKQEPERYTQQSKT